MSITQERIIELQALIASAQQSLFPLEMQAIDIASLLSNLDIQLSQGLITESQYQVAVSEAQAQSDAI